MEKYLSDENYYIAVNNAIKHKTGKKKKTKRAAQYKNNPEKYKHEIINYAKDFKSAYHIPKEIYDGVSRKKRIIYVPTMEEQIVHHMAINVLKPIFMRGMYEHSYGSIPERGPHLAKKRIEKWIGNKDKNMKYCLKMDIQKYFDSVPHAILKQKLSRIIKDKEFLLILYEIIDGIPGDVGIPIGFYTSQWFANWYLTKLDHYIKEELRAKYYVRYMDDMVIFGPNKRELHRIRRMITCYLNDNLGLKLKYNWQVFLFDYVTKKGEHVGRDLDFMGFRFYRDKTVLRKSLMIKATRKARRISKKKKPTVYDCRQMISYVGWLNCTNTYDMFKNRIKPYIDIRKLKKQIGYNQRKENEKCGKRSRTAIPLNQTA